MDVAVEVGEREGRRRLADERRVDRPRVVAEGDREEDQERNDEDGAEDERDPVHPAIFPVREGEIKQSPIPAVMISTPIQIQSTAGVTIARMPTRPSGITSMTVR